MHVVPADLTTLAGACLTASQELVDGWQSALGQLDVPGEAAGNTPGGPVLVGAHLAVAEAAGAALGHLSSVLEQDMDDLYAVAFDMTTTDEAAAESLETLTPGVPSDEPGPAPPTGTTTTTTTGPATG
ncbi:MAG: hypothetical protein WBP61_04075 [Nocardioides sp.]